MRKVCLKMNLIKGKFLFGVFNFLLLMSGALILTGGIFILFEPKRLLLSNLLSGCVPLTSSNNSTIREPSSTNIFNNISPFYLLTLTIIMLGFVLISVGTLGCWSTLMKNYWIIFLYFVVVTTLLILECVLFTITLLWPNCIGLNLSKNYLTESLQQTYASPKNDQFTTAIDLAQVLFECCGVNNYTDYLNSHWRKHHLGPSDIYVPLTCCKLINYKTIDKAENGRTWIDRKYGEMEKHLDPLPANITLCQNEQSNMRLGYRHSKGCIHNLEEWFRHQYINLLICGTVLIIIETGTLLSALITCAQLYKKATQNSKTLKSKEHSLEISTAENVNFAMY